MKLIEFELALAGWRQANVARTRRRACDGSGDAIDAKIARRGSGGLKFVMDWEGCGVRCVLVPRLVSCEMSLVLLLYILSSLMMAVLQ